MGQALTCDRYFQNVWVFGFRGGTLARPLRIEYGGAFYHVTGRGERAEEDFLWEGDYEKFKEYLLDAKEKIWLPPSLATRQGLKEEGRRTTISMPNVEA